MTLPVVCQKSRLRDSGHFRVRFVTNTTKESKAHLHASLSSLGFQIDQSEIFTSLTAARSLIEREKLRPMLFLEPEALEDFDGQFCLF